MPRSKKQAATLDRKRKPQPATSGPKRRARIALTEVEDAVRRLLNTHRYSPWLDTESAARYLARQPGTLKGWRSRGIGPVFRTVNDKLIRYHVDDLDAFVRGGGENNFITKNRHQ